MRLKDILGLAVTNLMNRGLRSWLTILGIVVGVAAVVAIVSIGEGLQESVSERLSSFGSNKITITPGYSGTFGRGMWRHEGEGGVRSGSLTINDEYIIKTIPDISYVSGVVSGEAEISYVDESASVRLQGYDPQVWRFMVTTELASGRYLEQGDTSVAVLGSRIANNLFKKPVLLNRQLIIDGKTFRIVGTLKPGVTGREDTSIFVPRDAARNVLTDIERDEFTSIVVQLEETGNITEVSDQIEGKLLVNHQVVQDEKDFTIITTLAAQERMADVTQTIKVFLGGIAAVSLLVGGIGIANTMFMSVFERTRQIGILKALGTTNREIMELFLFEAGLMGFVGGIFGILFGFIVSGTISMVGLRIFMGREATTVIPPQLIVFALFFSLFIGMISGVFPAKRAAELQPVEALRYE